MYINQANCFYGESIEFADQAVKYGSLPADVLEREGFGSVHTSSLSAVDLAVASFIPPERDLRWLIFAQILSPSTQVWSPSHYISAEIGAHNAIPLAINQVCNGSAVGLELARGLLSTSPHASVGIFTGDNFSAPMFDRWNSDSGISYGDAGTYLNVSVKQKGPLRVVSIEHEADSRFESMHRSSMNNELKTIDIRSRKRVFKKSSILSVPEIFSAHIFLLLSRTLEKISWSGPVRIYLPRLGDSVLQQCYISAVKQVLPESEILNPGRQTGHLGAGDCAASISDEMASSSPAHRILVLSAGAGFTWSCVALERN